MIVNLGYYMKDIHMHKPGAQQALKDFKLDRRGFVDDVVQASQICTREVGTNLLTCRTYIACYHLQSMGV
jgi:hypothetical protein